MYILLLVVDRILKTVTMNKIIYEIYKILSENFLADIFNKKNYFI